MNTRHASAVSVRSNRGRAEMARTDAGRRASDSLALRLVSAAILIPVALFVVWSGGWWLAVGAAVFAGAMAYEWNRMSGHGPRWGLMGALGVLNLAFPVVPIPVFCGGLVVIAFAFGAFNFRDFAMASFGALYAGGMPFALQLLRGGPWDGQAAALILMGIVWASDSAAYFAGRGFGGPSLSPESPNKTWSGAIGAIVASVLCGLIAAGLMRADALIWAMMAGGVSVIAQLGDLFESQLKRRFGVKDASALVPGHGGVMDRVDGLGAVCVGSVTLFLVFPWLLSRLGL